MRMRSASNMIENGQVHLPEKAPWLSVYLHEWRRSQMGNTSTRPIPPRRHQLVQGIRVRARDQGVLPRRRDQELATGMARWEDLGPGLRQYIIDHDIKGPRPRGAQGRGIGISSRL